MDVKFGHEQIMPITHGNYKAQGAGNQDASRSLVRGGPIAADLPAWALRRHDYHTQKIASPFAGQPNSSSPLFSPLMTVSETAAVFHLSPRTIRRMIRRGELYAVRIGRSVRIRTEDIQYIIHGIAND
jgi:excisionase family DNA binding protein